NAGDEGGMAVDLDSAAARRLDRSPVKTAQGRIGKDMDVAPGKVAGADVGADQQAACISGGVGIRAAAEQGAGPHPEQSGKQFGAGIGDALEKGCIGLDVAGKL